MCGYGPTVVWWHFYAAFHIKPHLMSLSKCPKSSYELTLNEVCHQHAHLNNYSQRICS